MLSEVDRRRLMAISLLTIINLLFGLMIGRIPLLGRRLLGVKWLLVRRLLAGIGIVRRCGPRLRRRLRTVADIKRMTPLWHRDRRLL